MVVNSKAACTGAVYEMQPCYGGTTTGPARFHQASAGGLGNTAQHTQPKLNLAQDLTSLNLNLDRKCTVCMTVHVCLPNGNASLGNWQAEWFLCIPGSSNLQLLVFQTR